MPFKIESAALSVLTQYPIKRAALFGSAARGDMTEHSDIDMLVEFLPDEGGIRFFGLHADLEKALGCHVDLLTYYGLDNDAKPEFKEAVLRDVKIIYEYQS